MPQRGDGATIDLASRVEKRFLGRTEVGVFEVGFVSAAPGAARFEIRHRGARERSGLEVLVRSGGEEATRIARGLESDQSLVDAALPLDFTRFELWSDDHGTRARVELMGATHVAIAFPPIRSYVRLHPDQRQALVRTFEALGAALQ